MELLTRDEFREAVFERDGFRCVICHDLAADAHHLLERRLWPDGGYYLDNGVTLCAEHHLEAEKTNLSVEDLREFAGITKVLLPPTLESGHDYDKWGNVILPDGKRMRGPLFYDANVSKVLQEKIRPWDSGHYTGGVVFMREVKYPRTPHLPWSQGFSGDDHKLTESVWSLSTPVVIHEKMDGENTTIYKHNLHARSIDSGYHESRTWVKNFAAKWQHELDWDQRVCGENLYAKHSIHYTDLPSYFLGFSYWDRDVCTSWYETTEMFELLGVTPAPVLFKGEWREAQEWCNNFESSFDSENSEGYVIRTAGEFLLSSFRSNVAKYVRAGHVTTDRFWRNAPIVRNELA